MATEMVSTPLVSVAALAPTASLPQSKTAEQKPAAEKPAEVVSQPVSGEELRTAVANVAQYVRRDLNFSLDEVSGQTVVKVIDSESNEVLRQIPSEEMVALARHLTELANERMVSGEQAKGLLMTARV